MKRSRFAALALVDTQALHSSISFITRGISGANDFLRSEGGLLYMNRIHTHRDVIYNEKNIEFLKNGALKLIELL